MIPHKVLNIRCYICTCLALFFIFVFIRLLEYQILQFHPSFLCNRKIFGYFIFMRAPVAGQKRACMGFFPVKRVGSKPKSTPSCDSGRFSVQSVFPL